MPKCVIASWGYLTMLITFATTMSSSYKLQAASYKLQTTNYKLQATGMRATSRGIEIDSVEAQILSDTAAHSAACARAMKPRHLSDTAAHSAACARAMKPRHLSDTAAHSAACARAMKPRHLSDTAAHSAACARAMKPRHLSDTAAHSAACARAMKPRHCLIQLHTVLLVQGSMKPRHLSDTAAHSAACARAMKPRHLSDTAAHSAACARAMKPRHLSDTAAHSAACARAMKPRHLSDTAAHSAACARAMKPRHLRCGAVPHELMPWRARALILALMALAAIVVAEEASSTDVPHISRCNLCYNCYLEDEQLPPGFVKLSPEHNVHEFSNAGSSHQAGRVLHQSAEAISSTGVQPGDELTNVQLGTEFSNTDSSRQAGRVLHQVAEVAAYNTGEVNKEMRAPHTGNGGQAGRVLHQVAEVGASSTDEVNEEKHAPHTGDLPHIGELNEDMFRMHTNNAVPKHTLPNCSVCYGCYTRLSSMASEAKFYDRTFQNEKGATSSFLFQATTNVTASGNAVVKLFCVPMAKRVGGKVPICSPYLVLKNMRLLLAIQKLSEECGYEEMVPRVWVGKVNAVIPELGYHVRWYGLWSEYADGVSLENFLHKGPPRPFPPNVILDVLMHKLNKTQVLKAASFDLLTSQCDRHAQNIFVLKLITPQVARERPLSADPQLLLDYRCYLPDGSEHLATNQDGKMQMCLRTIANMSVPQVKEHYGFDDDLSAINLQARATDMITKGFEWASKFGAPHNAVPKRYRIQPKCCRIEWSSRRIYACSHDWRPKFELPIGDMTTGRDWAKDRPDTGTYVGGTHEDN
eukprot:gene12581-15805_t